MFDLISQSMLFLLESLKNIVGNYGWAIIALTVLVRVVLWPISQSQMKSMKMMQAIQPKMKMIQERYKGDPQKLQAEMFKVYQEYKFNPLSGCLPMLVQIPLFIGLYWAISNPTFLPAGDLVFLDFIHLKHSGIISHAGTSNDGTMSIKENNQGAFLGIGKDHIVAQPDMVVTLTNGQVQKKKIGNANNALTVLPKDLSPGVPIRLTTSYKALGLEGYEGLVKTIDVEVMNNSTRELEKIEFTPPADKTPAFETALNTAAGKTVPHIDVLLLLLLFAGSMFLSQQMMTGQQQQVGNAQQQQLMKTMPIMFTVVLFFIPLPAGVLLYMVTNSLFQIFQTWVFQRSDSTPASTPPSQTTLDVSPEN